MRLAGLILLLAVILAGLGLRPGHKPSTPAFAARAQRGPSTPDAGLIPLPAPPPGLRLMEVAESPEAAVRRLLALPASERLNSATALLLSRAGRPDEATRIAHDLSQQDPAFIREHGTILIATLTACGDFPGALAFAAQGGPERPLWLAQTLDAWAREQPELAAHAVLSELDGEGFPEIAVAWAGRDPAALAEFVLGLTPGPERTLALEQARLAAESGTAMAPADRTRLIALLSRPPG